MLKVKKLGVLLRPTNLPFESRAVLNPGCCRQGRTVHLFYRAVDEKNISTIGYAKLAGPTKITQRSKKPVLVPKYKYERKGVEDPRLVFFNNKYYLFYAAYDGLDAVSAYATSRNLKYWRRGGVISPRMSYDLAEDIFRNEEQRLKDRYFLFESFFKDKVDKNILVWAKDSFLFPEKIKGKFALIHRILPDIQVVYFKRFKDLTDRDFWINYFKNLADYIVLESKYWYESRHISGGCPPIKTKAGWLLIYHAVEDANQGITYRAGAALLDKDDPCQVIGRLPEPLFSPELSWEISGQTERVVFPTGAVIFGHDLYIYYGAADQVIGVAKVDLNKLLKELVKGK